MPPELTAKAALAWRTGDLFGLEAGPAEVDLALADGVVTMRPLELAVSGGKVTLAPQVSLNVRPAILAVPAGPVIENVELTDEVCDSWMKYIAPIVAQATRAQGRFSLDLDETRVALADPASGEVSGRLRIVRGQLLPGPMLLAVVCNPVRPEVRGSAEPRELGFPLFRIEDAASTLPLRAAA